MWKVQNAVISAAGAGDNQIVAAVTDKKINVLAYVLVAGGAVSVKWRRGTTDLSGVLALAANGGLVVPSPGEDGEAWFSTAKNEALQINLGAAVAVGGHVLYYLS